MMKASKIEKFSAALFTVLFTALALSAAIFAPAAFAEPIDFGGVELTSLADGGTVGLGELSKGKPLYIVFSTPT